MVLPMTAMLLVANGPVRAQHINARLAGAGSVHAWSVPYNPVSRELMTGLQGFLRTNNGADLLSQAPALGVISRLSPDVEAHRRIVGALGLSTAFEFPLQAAIETSEGRALGDSYNTILNAYRSQDAEGKISEAVKTRAKEIVVAVSHGQMDLGELSAAATELAPFGPISAEVRVVGEMARSARAANAMHVAQTIASSLIQSKGSFGADDGKGGITKGAYTKDLPKEGRLQPAASLGQKEKRVNQMEALSRPAVEGHSYGEMTVTELLRKYLRTGVVATEVVGRNVRPVELHGLVFEANRVDIDTIRLHLKTPAERAKFVRAALYYIPSRDNFQWSSEFTDVGMVLPWEREKILAQIQHLEALSPVSQREKDRIIPLSRLDRIVRFSRSASVPRVLNIANQLAGTVFIGVMTAYLLRWSLMVISGRG